MAMGFMGVGSGYELGKMLDQIEAAQRVRLTPITQKKDAIDTKISAFGKLKSMLTQFSQATEKLQKAETFQRYLITGGDSYVKATATGKAMPGTYEIDIKALAKSHSITSGAIADKTTKLGNDEETRTITIQQANGQHVAVEIGKDDTSLESIANAINQAKVTDKEGNSQPSTINAAVVRVSDGQYQLVLTAKETGVENTITSVSSSDDKLNAMLSYGSTNPADNGMQESAKAQDATFIFNGIEIRSAANKIKDVVPGLDITLTRVTSSPETLTVEADNENMKTVIKEWVDAFNELQSTLASLTKFTKPDANKSEKKEGQESANGPLIGDATLRDIDQQLRSIFSHGQDGDLKVLSQIGINMDKDGKLTIKDSELDKVLSNDAGAVVKLFAGDGEKTGIANEVVSTVDAFTRTKGTVDTVTDGLKSTLKSVQKSYDLTESSIEQTLARYRKQFTHLDTLIGSLNNLSNYLTNQFAAMN